MIVRMWEARVVPGMLDDAVAYLRDVAVPDALATKGCHGAEGFRAAGDPGGTAPGGSAGGADLIVLVTRWEQGVNWQEPPPPERLWDRDHAWTFIPVA